MLLMWMFEKQPTPEGLTVSRPGCVGSAGGGHLSRGPTWPPLLSSLDTHVHWKLAVRLHTNVTLITGCSLSTCLSTCRCLQKITAQRRIKKMTRLQPKPTALDQYTPGRGRLANRLFSEHVCDAGCPWQLLQAPSRSAAARRVHPLPRPRPAGG